MTKYSRRHICCECDIGLFINYYLYCCTSKMNFRRMCNIFMSIGRQDVLCLFNKLQEKKIYNFRNNFLLKYLIITFLHKQ